MGREPDQQAWREEPQRAPQADPVRRPGPQLLEARRRALPGWQSALQLFLEVEQAEQNQQAFPPPSSFRRPAALAN